MSHQEPRPSPRRWVVLPGVLLLPPCTALLVPRPTPLLSMQVALLRGQSQLEPVQPGSHTHWPREQRPRSVDGEKDGRGEPHSLPPPRPPTSAREGLRLRSLSWDFSSRGQSRLCLTFWNLFPSVPPIPFCLLLPTLQPESLS